MLIPAGGAVMTDPWRQWALAWLLERYTSLLPDAELVVANNEDEPYNRAAARNAAFEASTQPMLLVADADTIFHYNQIRQAIDLLEVGAPWVVPYGEGRYYNLSQHVTDLILGHMLPRAELDEPDEPQMWEHKLTSHAGLLVLPRSAWETVGGYPEGLVAWGYDDDCFRAALDVMVGVHAHLEGPHAWMAHCWHPAPESERFGQPFIEHNRAIWHRFERARTREQMAKVLEEHR